MECVCVIAVNGEWHITIFLLGLTDKLRWMIGITKNKEMKMAEKMNLGENLSIFEVCSTENK